MKTILVFLSAAFWSYAMARSIGTDPKPFNDDMVDYINGLDSTWKAGHNAYFQGRPISAVRNLMGFKKLNSSLLSPFGSKEERNYNDLPAEFDARTKWPNCPTIAEIRDQSNCGGCWAVSTASAISDRICIASNGASRPHISANDLLSCGSSSGPGCEGGAPILAFRYWVDNGLVSGGNYTSHAGCKPYPLAPCEHYITGSLPSCGKVAAQTPQCEHKCQAGYAKSYEQDKYYGLSAYAVKGDEKAMRWEILNKGPIVAGMTVYEDFTTYKSGVYQHHAGGLVGEHAVKIVGWGSENNTPYWLVANTWNSDWGDKGFFKIVRGKNDSGIEGELAAGEPKIN